MKRLFTILITCILAITLVGCSGNSNDHKDEAKTPSGSSVQKGQNYQDVVANFEEKGFTNIKTQVLDDLVTGFLVKDGEVESVSVDGNKDYSSDVWYPNTVEVIISYHTFPKEDASDTNSTNKDNSNSGTQSTTDSSQQSNQEILTIANNNDLVTLLAVKDPSDPIVSAFATKYAGKTIAFDGNTAAVNNHEGFTTRFDYLIYAGDYNASSASGPNFQFSDVAYYDLHLTGSNIPDTFGVGQNIHIVATVGQYNPSSSLFQLKPVSIEMR